MIHEIKHILRGHCNFVLASGKFGPWMSEDARVFSSVKCQRVFFKGCMQQQLSHSILFPTPKGQLRLDKVIIAILKGDYVFLLQQGDYKVKRVTEATIFS